MRQINSEALISATEWFVELSSGEATEKDRQAWRNWLNAAPENKLAWQQVESVTGHFNGLDATTSLSVLDRPQDERNAILSDRRRALKQLSVLLAVSSGSWLTYKHKPWQSLLADYTTATGEIQHITLGDGSRLVLNTNTKIAVAFTETHRHIRLYDGEVYVETAHESHRAYRPFAVTTDHGSAIALGTRFSVQKESSISQVSVYQDAVEVRATDGTRSSRVLKAGQAVVFSEHGIQQTMPADSTANAWTKGFIIVDKMPLSRFVNELSRYRTGVLRCDPSIAALEISGAFPIDDTDGTLQSISKILPIRIESYTRFWTLIRPSPDNSMTS